MSTTHQQREAELAARLTTEHVARMERYDFFYANKQRHAMDPIPRKDWNWTPALTIGPASELWLKPGGIWSYD